MSSQRAKLVERAEQARERGHEGMALHFEAKIAALSGEDDEGS